MHYASYKTALSDRFRNRDELPTVPLIVDLGCGPATTLFALADWFEDLGAPRQPAYLGLDTSTSLLSIADALINADANALRARYLLRNSIDVIGERELQGVASGCDGVIFALSYILHQEFMADMTLLAAVMSRIRGVFGEIPAWFLLQDANYPDRPQRFVEIWPENRIQMLTNLCEPIGYRVRSVKRRFNAPHFEISSAGTFRTPATGTTDNVCAFFDRVDNH